MRVLLGYGISKQVFYNSRSPILSPYPVVLATGTGDEYGAERAFGLDAYAARGVAQQFGKRPAGRGRLWGRQVGMGCTDGLVGGF